jgi:hypothetical protein
MQLSSFLQQARRPVHTPDRLLNAFLACRTSAKPFSSDLIAVLWRASTRAARAIGRRKSPA